MELVLQEEVPVQVAEHKEAASSKGRGKPANMALVMLQDSYINLERRASESNLLKSVETGLLLLNSQRISSKNSTL